MENTFDLKKFLIENKLTTNSRQESTIDEGVLSWIKDKAQQFATKINQLTGNALIKALTEILPEDLVDFVKAQADAYEPSQKVLKEYKIMYLTNLLEGRRKKDKTEYKARHIDASPDWLKSDEEINNLNDKEYQNYLQQVADNIAFPIDYEGEMRDKSKFALYRFFKSKGLRVTTELIADAQPAFQTIERKIGTMNLPRPVKKLLIYGAYTLFITMTAAKFGSMVGDDNTVLEEEATETI